MRRERHGLHVFHCDDFTDETDADFRLAGADRFGEFAWRRKLRPWPRHIGDAATLLDVGGGPGTYAVLLAQKYPTLEVTVLDLPEVAAIAAELIAEAGMTDRVRTRPGNAVTDDYGESVFDAVLFSGVLHQMSPATIRQMLKRAHTALKPGGRALISDIMLEPAKTAPPFATLFSLQMLLSSADGAVFSAEECAAWLNAAGFADVTVQRLPPPLPYYVVTGSK